MNITSGRGFSEPAAGAGNGQMPFRQEHSADQPERPPECNEAPSDSRETPVPQPQEPPNDLTREAISDYLKALVRMVEETNETAKRALTFAFIPGVTTQIAGLAMVAAAVIRPLFFGSPPVLATTEFVVVLIVGALLLLLAPVPLILGGFEVHSEHFDDAIAKAANMVAGLDAIDEVQNV